MLPLRIYKVAVSIWATGPHELRHCFQEGAITTLAFPQGGFCRNPFGNVPPDGRCEDMIVHLPLTE